MLIDDIKEAVSDYIFEYINYDTFSIKIWETEEYRDAKDPQEVIAYLMQMSSKQVDTNIVKKLLENIEVENIEEVKEYSEEVLDLFNILPFRERVEKRKAELAELLKSHTFEYLKTHYLIFFESSHNSHP